MRTYERTHSWITFQLDLRSAPWVLWVRLGEAASKCVHLTNVPLQPSTSERLHQLYLAKGAAATTAIEGNTLSEDQVLKHVRGELTLPPSQEYLQREVDNILSACNEIARQLAERRLSPLSPEIICEYNRRVREGLPEKEGISPPGVVRSESVLVGQVYRGAPAEDCPWLLNRLCQWLNGPDFEPRDGYTLPFAILKAVVAHLYLAWIHPFGDGNGRTARLLELHILLAAGVPQPAVHLLSNHYNQTRGDYYRQLEYASKSGGNVVPFIQYAVAGFVDGLREQLKFVRDQQWEVAWQHFIYEKFRGRDAKSQVRQRHLALDLGALRDWIRIADISELTPRLARAYAAKTGKTIQRDINALIKDGLVLRESQKVRANREIILGLLPLVNHEV